MRKTIFLISFLALLPMLPMKAQQWIGAVSDEDAHIPSNRDYVGTGTLNAKGKPDWQAANPLSRQSIWLRKQFGVGKKLQRATVQVAGLGFYELSVNNQPAAPRDILSPAWSDYDKSVFYNTIDVTSLLQQGRNNTLQVLLGNGFYNEQGGRYTKMKISYGPPTLHLRLLLEYADGRRDSVLTDGTWQYAPSNITFNSIYGGEDEDARIKPKKWSPVVIQRGPKGTLRPQRSLPIRMMETFPVKQCNRLTAQQISEASTKKHTIPAGTFVLDMGQNLSGFPLMTVSGKAGQTVRLYPSETLTPQGTANQKQTGSPYYLSYTLAGKGQETWHPHFTYYGYRYIQVEGAVMEGDDNPQGLPVIHDIHSCFIYNSAPKTGNFECSNKLFNDTYRLIDRAVRSNWQAVWTDCPHREKLGWLEQDWLNGEGLVYNYDCRAMLEQTLQNIADAQHADGAVPTTAPEYIRFKGKWLDPFAESPEWGGALVALPFLYDEHYGSDSLIRQYLPAMLRYVDYLQTKDSCRVLKQGLGDWYDYGPGRSGFSQNTPMPLVATAHYYQWTKLTAQAAARCGKEADALRLSELQTEILQAFRKEFLHVERSAEGSVRRAWLGTGSQTANAIGLAMGLVPKECRQAVMDTLVADINHHNCRLTTGDVGNRYLFQALLNGGQQELWYCMLNHYDVPGYGYQINRGMTTLTEQWNPAMGASMNHFMMAHINNHFLPYIVGLQLHRGRLVVNPHAVGDLKWAKGSIALPQGGEAKVEWKRTGKNEILLSVDVDQDTEYELRTNNNETQTLHGPYNGRIVVGDTGAERQ